MINYKVSNYDALIGNVEISLADFIEMYANFAKQTTISETSTQNYFQINNIRSTKFPALKDRVVTEVGYAYDDSNINFVFYDGSKMIVIVIKSDQIKNDPLAKFQLLDGFEYLVTKYFIESQGILRPKAVEKVYE